MNDKNKPENMPINKVIDLSSVSNQELEQLKSFFYLKLPKPKSIKFNKELSKKMKNLKEVKTHIKLTSIKWARENNKDNIYGAIPKVNFLNYYLKRDLNRLFLLSYDNDELRFINCNNLQPEGIYLIENKQEFLEVFPTNILNEYLNKNIKPMLRGFLEVLNIVPTNGVVKIENGKINFYDYIYNQDKK